MQSGQGQSSLEKYPTEPLYKSADNAEKFIVTRKIDSFESHTNFAADYYIPDLKLLEAHRPIGYFCRLHQDYLKQKHSARYTALLLTCKLRTYLADLNE